LLRWLIEKKYLAGCYILNLAGVMFNSNPILTQSTEMKNLNQKFKLGLAEYKKTLILFTILVAVMSLVIFIPLKNEKLANNNNSITAANPK
jgi:hypothetical protein